MSVFRNELDSVCKWLKRSVLKACCIRCEESDLMEVKENLNLNIADKKSVTSESFMTDLESELFVASEEKVSICSLEFNNGLPYELSLQVIPKTTTDVKAIYTVKAGEPSVFDAKNDSTLAVNLCYLKNIWSFSQRISSLKDSQICEFTSEDGKIIALTNDSHVGVEGKLSYTISSPVWIFNETQFNLAYLQQLITDQYIKTYQPTGENFHQPLLLDCYLNQIAIACTDRNGNRENWTRLPLDKSGPIELFINGNFYLIYSFINQINNIFGTTVLLTENEKDPYHPPQEEGKEIYFQFINDLSCDTFLEIISNETIIYTEIVNANDSLMGDMPNNAMIAVHLTYLGEKWTYKEKCETLRQQEYCIFETETGKSLHVNYCSLALINDRFLFRIYGKLGEKPSKSKKPSRVSLFRNSLPCALHLEVFEDNKFIQDEFINALYGTKLWKGSEDSTFSLNFTNMGEKWIFRERTEIIHTLQKWKFISESGRTCYAMIDSIEHEDSKFQFSIKELSEVALES